MRLTPELPDIALVEGVTCNVYIVMERDGLTILDTGMPGSAAKVLREIVALGRQPQDVRRILLTHQHVDHIGGAAQLALATGATVYAPQMDTPAIEGTGPRELPKGPLSLVFRIMLATQLKPVAVHQQVAGGETLPIFESEGGLRVVATPGHTAGHVSFYLPARKLLFAGDACRSAKGELVPSPNIFNADTPQALRSFAALRTMDIEACLVGHGAPVLRNANARFAATTAAPTPAAR